MLFNNIQFGCQPVIQRSEERKESWIRVKVDRNFPPSNGDDTRNRLNVMFRHVLNIAKEMGLTCIAEGVETNEQLDILCRNGCDIAQGYYFDKPLPVREIEKRLE